LFLLLLSVTFVFFVVKPLFFLLVFYLTHALVYQVSIRYKKHSRRLAARFTHEMGAVGEQL
jgi:hypothetical protein